MDIKNTFLNLTSKTYPDHIQMPLDYKEIVGIVQSMTKHRLQKDSYGNRYVNIPLESGEQSSVLFTCHLDTATMANVNVTHVFDNNYIKTDGKSILGADDKAGTTIMLYMMNNNVPGLYYFYLGEEVGCKGSKDMASKHKLKRNDKINKVISFDRRGTDDVITFQNRSRRCCSENFAKKLSEELNEKGLKVNVEKSSKFNYSPCDSGVMTDSAQFMEIYSECTNISVGYYSEHCATEKQDIVHLEKLAKTCVLVDWENLPVERDYTKEESKTYHNNSYSHNNYSNNYNTQHTVKKPVVSSLVEDIWLDSKTDALCTSIFDKSKNVYTKFDIPKEQLELEKEAIKEHLELLLDEKVNIIEWDGVNVKFSKLVYMNETDWVTHIAEPINRVLLEPCIEFLSRYKTVLDDMRAKVAEIEKNTTNPEFIKEYVKTINEFVNG